MLTVCQYHGADRCLIVLQQYLARYIYPLPGRAWDKTGVVRRVIAWASGRTGHDHRNVTGTRQDIDLREETVCINLAFHLTTSIVRPL